jgi:hypothetical protein
MRGRRQAATLNSNSTNALSIPRLRLSERMMEYGGCSGRHTDTCTVAPSPDAQAHAEERTSVVYGRSELQQGDVRATSVPKIFARECGEGCRWTILRWCRVLDS